MPGYMHAPFSTAPFSTALTSAAVKFRNMLYRGSFQHYVGPLLYLFFEYRLFEWYDGEDRSNVSLLLACELAC